MAQKSQAQSAANGLLRTNLTPPRLRPVRVARAHLLARLGDGLKYKLTLLSAPAGFGKTTLVTEWFANHPLHHPRRVMTLHLDALYAVYAEWALADHTA